LQGKVVLKAIGRQVRHLGFTFLFSHKSNDCMHEVLAPNVSITLKTLSLNEATILAIDNDKEFSRKKLES
jgi:predicted naringenin-chalcone synthase